MPGRSYTAIALSFSRPGGAGEEGQRAVFVAEVTDKQQEIEYADDDDVFFVDAEAGAEDEEWDDKKSVDRSEGDSSDSSDEYEPADE